MPLKPTSIATAHKCSVCDLDWKKHGEKPTLEDCIALLRAELSKRRSPNEVEIIGKPFYDGITKGFTAST